MSKLIKADAHYLPETFDDEQLVAHLRNDDQKRHRRRMFWGYALLFASLTASFVLRYWK